MMSRLHGCRQALPPHTHTHYTHIQNLVHECSNTYSITLLYIMTSYEWNCLWQVMQMADHVRSNAPMVLALYIHYKVHTTDRCHTNAYVWTIYSNQTAKLKQCSAATRVVALSYTPGTSNWLPSLAETKDRRATDTAVIALLEVVRGVLMDVIGQLTAHVFTTSTSTCGLNNGRQGSTQQVVTR